MSDRSGIEIDYCPQCRGVWLDRGELDKIIERSSQQLPSVAPPPLQQQRKPDDSHYGYEHGKRKKSWLSEIFD
jgi:Zn-finger nucleic acid-binding protein